MSPHDDDPTAFDDCAEFVGLAARAADGAIDDAGRARLEAHIDGCDACRRAVETQRLVHGLVALAYDVAPSPAFVARVVNGVETPTNWLDRLDFRAWTWRVAPVAAALLVAAGITVATSQVAAGSPAPATDAELASVSMPVAEALTDSDPFSDVWAQDDEASPEEGSR